MQSKNYSPPQCQLTEVCMGMFPARQCGLTPTQTNVNLVVDIPVDNVKNKKVPDIPCDQTDGMLLGTCPTDLYMICK